MGAVLVLATAGCGGKTTAAKSQSPTPTASESQRLPNTVEVVDSSQGGIFRPQAMTVPAGTVITWQQTGTAAHTVQSVKTLFNSHPSCSIEGTQPHFRESTGCMKKGDTFTFKFTSPGQYFYYCLPHGSPGETLEEPAHGMAGTINVT